MKIIKVHTATINRIEVHELKRKPREFIRISSPDSAPEYLEINRNLYDESIDFYECYDDECSRLESLFNEFTASPESSSESTLDPIQLTQLNILV